MNLRSILIAVCLLLGLQAARAETAPSAVLSDSELGDIHAGFLDPNGLSISLGAVMKSFVDGNLVLQSTMAVNASGITTTQLLGEGALPLSPAEMAALPAAARVGAVVAGAGGTTSFVHSLSDNGLTNMVVNTANGRNILQNTAITVTIPNLQALEQQATLAGFATQLHDMVGIGLLAASPR
jgi:hypothetical protein